ncbi:MAG: hypothetical protein P8181_01055 [bacterium]
MRVVTGAILALMLVVALVTPGLLQAQQLPMPVQKIIYPGVTTVEYAGETLVFTTSIALLAKFQFVNATEIEITVSTHAGGRATAAAPGNILRIYWQNEDEYIYDGEPPEEEWTGILLTEGGFTEK